ncbi:MAG: LysE family translocator [Caulobacterales bacterium]|jgi:threonine/homoserine/homoserine lactone efflux protein
MDFERTVLFVGAATVLLGSPGPGIGALIAVGRQGGFTAGQRFFWGLQAGLALAAGLTAVGLFSLVSAIPLAHLVLTAIATAYLLWLAFKIATADVGKGLGGASPQAATVRGGFLLGASNPKSYMAFASLFGAYPVLVQGARADLSLKWLCCVLVMVVVDMLWLWAGAALGRIDLNPRRERLMNVAMAAIIVATALLSLI